MNVTDAVHTYIKESNDWNVMGLNELGRGLHRVQHCSTSAGAMLHPLDYSLCWPLTWGSQYTRSTNGWLSHQTYVYISVYILTSVVNGLLAVSIDEQFQRGEASDVKLLGQLLFFNGVHFGQTQSRFLLLQFPSSLGVNRLQMFTVTTPGSVCTNQYTKVMGTLRTRVVCCGRVSQEPEWTDRHENELLITAVAVVLKVSSSCYYWCCWAQVWESWSRKTSGHTRTRGKQSTCVCTFAWQPGRAANSL